MNVPIESVHTRCDGKEIAVTREKREPRGNKRPPSWEAHNDYNELSHFRWEEDKLRLRFVSFSR